MEGLVSKRIMQLRIGGTTKAQDPYDFERKSPEE